MYAEEKKNNIELNNIPISLDVELKQYNLLINPMSLKKQGFEYGDSLNIKIGDIAINDVPYFSGFYGKIGARLISGDPNQSHLVLSDNYGSISDTMYINLDNTAIITLNEKQKFKKIQDSFNLIYSNDRKKYKTDEIFCNFRAMNVGKLNKNTIFRGASPSDNKRNRANYVNKLLEHYNIMYDINIADPEKKVQMALKSPQLSINYYKSLYNNNHYLLLPISANFKSQESINANATIIKTLTKEEGPFYLHCLEGKDRTGFTCLLIGALCGATYAELQSDYMETYYNYYNINKTMDVYNTIVTNVFNEFIYYLTSKNNIFTISATDIFNGAVNYLIRGGLSKNDINDFIFKFTS